MPISKDYCMHSQTGILLNKETKRSWVVTFRQDEATSQHKQNEQLTFSGVSL